MKVQIADAIIIKDNKVLLVQQRKPSAFGLWSFPGGHVEAGETFEQAILREVQEEIGVTLTQAQPFKVNDLLTKDQGILDFHTFTGEISEDIILRDEELMAYGWFSLDSLEHMQDQLRSPLLLVLAREALVD